MSSSVTYLTPPCLTSHSSLRNKALLSFGADAEEPIDDSAPKTKFKSAHDVATDGRLSAQVIDDRGTSATLPADFMGEEMRAPPPKKRKGDEDDTRRSEEVRFDPAMSLAADTDTCNGNRSD